MSEQVNQAAAENTNQAAPIENKQEGQQADPAIKPEAGADPSTSKPEADPAPKAEDKKPEEVAYVLKQADGSLVAGDVADKIVAFAKAQGLSNAQAQAIFYRENAAKADEVNQYNERKSQWVSQVQNDKEIGGEAFKSNVNAASQVIKKFASEEFVKILDETGLGNHPELVRVFSRIAKTMKSDQFVSNSGESGSSKTTAQILYDKT